MRLLDCNRAAPEENLALDEALLESVEAGAAPDTLRFWESPVKFVVLGTGQRFAEEVNETACAEDGVPVLRRCSAGGCVLQGPGSLNYTVCVRFDTHPEVRSLHGSYDFLLGRIGAALDFSGLTLTMEGASDIACDGRKISGNAQRRKRNAILHHGTLLYRADYDGMARYLKEPEERPDYRGTRTHESFVGELPLEAATMKANIAEAFKTQPGDLTDAERDAMMKLATEKYNNDAWNRRR